MKEFYDIWLLVRHFDFDSDDVTEAIMRTFAQRRTAIPPLFVALSRKFWRGKAGAVEAFQKRLGRDYVPLHSTMFLQ